MKPECRQQLLEGEKLGQRYGLAIPQTALSGINGTLIGLAALPALAAIYILRNRYRRQPVSSLLLWRQQAVVKEGGFKVDRLQLPFIFFLELIALLLLVVAATGPRWQLPSTIRPLIVIADEALNSLVRRALEATGLSLL